MDMFDFDNKSLLNILPFSHTADEVKAVNPATGELAGTPIKQVIMQT